MNLKNTGMIHPKSEVLSKRIGKGTSIWQYAIVLPDAVIGENCNINCHTFIENKVVIGNNVTIKSGVYLWDGITVEDDVFIGPNATFVNNPVPRSKQYPKEHIGVYIGKGASIGANATIMGNIKIGSFSMIGAGSVVTKDIPDNTLWYGNPAKHKGFITNDGIILDMNLKDKTTGDNYEYKNNQLIKG